MNNSLQYNKMNDTSQDNIPEFDSTFSPIIVKTELNNNFTSVLPDDVLKMIYYDYFSIQVICNKLDKILLSQDSHNLKYTELENYLENTELENYLENVVFTPFLI